MNTFDRISEEIGYTPKTTFWDDFTIAEAFCRSNGVTTGVPAIDDAIDLSSIQDTYDRSFRGWKDNVEYITELSLVLNHKIWQHHFLGNKAMAVLYDRLWRELDTWCYDNLKGDDLTYYYKVTD